MSRSPRLLEDVPADVPAVRYRLPDPALRRYVSGYHVYGAGAAGSAARDEWFFPAWANVRVQRCAGPWRFGYGNAPHTPVPRAALFGPSRAGAHSVSQGGQLIGFGVTPVGWWRLFGVPAHRFVDRLTPLADVWPHAGALEAALGPATACEQVWQALDATLLATLGPPHPDEPLIARLFDLLVADHDVDLDAAAARLGCTPIKLRRVARLHFGFAPKMLLRRSRFLKSLIAIYGREAGDWGRLIDASYHDQSHFIRDAHYFLSMAPGAFLALDRPLTFLSIRARTEALGAPMQALHRIVT